MIPYLPTELFVFFYSFTKLMTNLCYANILGCVTLIESTPDSLETKLLEKTDCQSPNCYQ